MNHKYKYDCCFNNTVLFNYSFQDNILNLEIRHNKRKVIGLLTIPDSQLGKWGKQLIFHNVNVKGHIKLKNQKYIESYILIYFD